MQSKERCTQSEPFLSVKNHFSWLKTCFTSLPRGFLVEPKRFKKGSVTNTNGSSSFINRLKTNNREPTMVLGKMVKHVFSQENYFSRFFSEPIRQKDAPHRTKKRVLKWTSKSEHHSSCSIVNLHQLFK